MNLFNEPEAPRAKRRGHAAIPGSGPEGETCKTCRYYSPVEYRDYVHRKCALMADSWTHGPGMSTISVAPKDRLIVDTELNRITAGDCFARQYRGRPLEDLLASLRRRDGDLVAFREMGATPEILPPTVAPKPCTKQTLLF